MKVLIGVCIMASGLLVAVIWLLMVIFRMDQNWQATGALGGCGCITSGLGLILHVIDKP